MVLGELEYKIEELEKEINLLKDSNCKLQVCNNDLTRQYEILLNLVNDLVNNELNFNEFQGTYFKMRTILNNNLNKDITNELLEVKNQLGNNKLFRLCLLMLEFNCNYTPDKQQRLILFS